ncbi:MAG: hypothetical protein GXO39_04025 [Thermotogae bacterium]|nr:hypothetical protein [Thermotogota bacterium]
MLLVLFAVLTLSWMGRLVKHPFLVLALKAVGFVGIFLGLYTYYKLADPLLAFPFFLMSSWAFYRSSKRL